MYIRARKRLSLIIVILLIVTSLEFTLVTKIDAAEENLTISLKADHPNIVNVDEVSKSVNVIKNTNFEKLNQQISNGIDSVLRVLDINGIPKKETDELLTGDKFVLIKGSVKKEYTIQVNYFTLKNVALNPDERNIKVSSIRGNTVPLNAFNGESTGNAGSGYQVDQSQSKQTSISAGKDTFWLAVDLGEIQAIEQFSVAWGTTVSNLTTRLKDSKYRVEYTNDPEKWAALSNAAVSGADGILNYSKPVGWDLAYEQDVRELPNANGNKVFMSNLETPISARYVMLTGELASSWIEIYNFFVFQKESGEGESDQPVYPTEELAKIVPDYEGMSLTVGRPAIVRKDTAVPKIHITAKEDINVSGKLKDPNGRTIYTSAKQTVESNSTIVVAPDVEVSVLGTYVFEWEIEGRKKVYEKIYFTAVDEDISKYNYTNPYPALYLHEDKGVYVPDYLGNTVMDYSNVGYQGGGIEIPNVPVKVILEPSDDSTSDDTERIQNAINMIGRNVPDSNGFRGALLLKAGTFRVSSSIRISESGIVIKGEGDDHENIEDHPIPLSPTNWKNYKQSEEAKPNVTKVVATWVASSYDKNTAIFNFSGSAESKSGNPIDIVDQYVPAGGTTIKLASVSGLSVGDTVNIRRAINAAWAQDLKMDVITDAPGVPSANQWAENGVVDSAYVNNDEERTIKSINHDTNEIILLEPLADALNMRYGVSTVTKYEPTGRINNVGIENIQVLSRFNDSTTAINSAFGVDYKSFDDELHAQLAVRFGNAQNAWARRITTYHIDVAVSISTGVSKLTIQDVNCLEPVGGTGGERRYSFSNAGGTLVLSQRNYTRYTRHGFIVMGNIIGPNVFYNNKAEYEFDANEPHLRWSTGGLFDNFNGRVYVQNRWNNGTAHGWSGANYTLYNNTGPYMISQNPLAANYLFGQQGERLPFVMDAVDPGNVPNFHPYEYSNGSKMTPESLYIQQLKDRLGQEAVNNIEKSDIPAYIDESSDFTEKFASLEGILVEGVPLENFNKHLLSYTVPIALDYTVLPEITYSADGNANVVVSNDGNKAVKFTVSMPGKLDTVYIVNYGIIDKNVPIISSGGQSSIHHLIDDDHKTSWSSSGTPWVQFYLGDKPASINSVSLGYSRDTQIRRSYYFDFEISNDGYNWTKVIDDSWRRDNLGNGHIMGMEVLPGAGGDSITDYETFIFPEGISARLMRVSMFGARSGTGTGTSNVNKYWAIDVDAAVNEEHVKVSGVEISDKELSLGKGETKQLTASVLPANADNKAVTWSSSNPGVATVDNTGLVTAIEEGNATITIKTVEGGFLDTSIVTVNENAFPSIDLSQLKNLISAAKAISNDDSVYTENTFAALQAAIMRAESALERIKTDLELTEALETLKAALDGLVETAPDQGKDIPEQNGDTNQDDDLNPSQGGDHNQSVEKNHVQDDKKNQGHNFQTNNKGAKLPNTASSMYTMLVTGIALLLTAFTVLLFVRNRRFRD